MCVSSVSVCGDVLVCARQATPGHSCTKQPLQGLKNKVSLLQ